MFDKQNREKKLSIWIRLIGLLILIVFLTFFIYQSDLMQLFMSRERMLAFIDSLGFWAPIGLILMQALQVVVAPIPGEITNFVGGFLYGPIWGTILSTIGVTIGSYVAFILARIFGQPFVEKYVSKSIIRRFDYLLHHKGAFLVFIIFLIPGTPKDSLCYLLGLGHLTSVEFLVISGVGRLLGTILETLGGDYIRNEQYQNLFVLAGFTLIIIFVTMVYKQKIERLFRKWHVMDYKKKKQKRNRSK